ncbi:MAG: c-type cytochrome [Vicinamibacterales bacterium]
MSDPRGGLTSAIAVSMLVGGLAVGATLRYAPMRSTSPGRVVPSIATEDYGRRLIAQTSEMLGPDHPDPERRYTASRLSCASCHLGTGTEPGTLNLLQVTEHYPRFSGRVNANTDIEDRINECMQRSMNGKPLPMDSPEMIAMAAYLRSLGAEYAAMGAGQKKAVEPAAFKTPNRAANLAAGQQTFTDRCSICHGADGLGLLATRDKSRGYLFPPLWGPDSFNDGAGMHRVLTAARFIKARMPLGKSDLTDDQAFDVAAFINNQPRPNMPNLDKDYPDRTTKPVDNAYGPFADSFPLEQHRLGPFQPIEAYYKSLKKSK